MPRSVSPSARSGRRGAGFRPLRRIGCAAIRSVRTPDHHRRPARGAVDARDRRRGAEPAGREPHRPASQPRHSGRRRSARSSEGRSGQGARAVLEGPRRQHAAPPRRGGRRPQIGARAGHGARLRPASRRSAAFTPRRHSAAPAAGCGHPGFQPRGGPPAGGGARPLRPIRTSGGAGPRTPDDPHPRRALPPIGSVGGRPGSRRRPASAGPLGRNPAGPGGIPWGPSPTTAGWRAPGTPPPP